MKQFRLWSLAVVLVFFAFAPSANAEEKKISRADLPAAVEKTLARESKGATIRGLSSEVDQGRTFYEAELTIRGHNRDLLIDEAGNLVEAEEELEFDSLPKAVQDGLRQAAGSGMITRIESISKMGKLVGYEAIVKIGGKNTEVKLNPDGSRQ